MHVGFLSVTYAPWGQIYINARSVAKLIIGVLRLEFQEGKQITGLQMMKTVRA